MHMHLLIWQNKQKHSICINIYFKLMQISKHSTLTGNDIRKLCQNFFPFATKYKILPAVKFDVEKRFLNTQIFISIIAKQKPNNKIVYFKNKTIFHLLILNFSQKYFADGINFAINI